MCDKYNQLVKSMNVVSDKALTGNIEGDYVQVSISEHELNMTIHYGDRPQTLEGYTFELKFCPFCDKPLYKNFDVTMRKDG